MNERYAVYMLASQRNGTLWNQTWKLKLIEASTPKWLDLDPTAC
jgi:predicted GIY-YIG superfamily endonuclease